MKFYSRCATAQTLSYSLLRSRSHSYIFVLTLTGSSSPLRSPRHPTLSYFISYFFPLISLILSDCLVQLLTYIYLIFPNN